MFYDRFVQSVERWPDAVAVEIQRQKSGTDSGTPSTSAPKPLEQYTYAQLRTMAESVGRWLLEQRFQSGALAQILVPKR